MSATDTFDRDKQLDEVLAAYLEAAERGWAPDQQKLLACYPHLADDLGRFFANQDRVERAAAPLRTASADGEPAPDAGWPIVAGYEILGKVGRGGMGVVYRARQRSCDRVVALKMILTDLQVGPPERERFRSEAQAVARLQHPGIVQLFEVGEAEGRPYLALEYVAGGSLADRLDGTPLPPREAAELVEALARAVQHAHEQGVVHRDLKPANVLLAASGLAPDAKPLAAGWAPKVTDFGLAKRLDADRGQTASGAIVGTPSYMAPEQARGKSKEIGPATDVYALGVILYELLTGRPPFRAATRLDTVMQVVSEEPVPPSRLQPKVPRDLETVCLKCLQKEPAKRYARAADLAGDLRRYREGRPILARPVGPVWRGWRWCRRNPAVAGLLAAVALALLLGAAVATLFAFQANQNAIRAGENASHADQEAEEARANARRANDRAYVADLRLVQRAWEEHDVPRMRELLEAQTPEKTDGVERRGFEWGYWWRLSHQDFQTLQGHSGPVTCVAFSPDGTRLASASGDGRVRVWDAQTGKEVLRIDGSTGPIYSVCFSPDGRRLAGAGGEPLNGEVRVWDVQTGRKQLALKGQRRLISSVCFSPDGTRLATASGDRDQSIKVWDAQTGQELMALTGYTGAVKSVCFSPDGTRLGGASADNDRPSGEQTVKVWDAQTGRKILTLEGHTGAVNSVCFSPDGRRLASASEDRTVKVWDAPTGQLLFSLRGHTDIVTSVCFSPDGTRLATGSRGGDQSIKVWDAQTGQELMALMGYTGAVNSVCFSPDGQRLASAGERATVKVWDMQAGQEARTFKGHTTKTTVRCICFSPDGQRLASASTGTPFQQREPAGEVKVWDAQTGQEQLTLKGPCAYSVAACFSPDGTRLAVAWGGAVRVWDAQAGQLLSLKAIGVWVTGVCFNPDGTRLATASRDRDQSIKVWDAQTGQELLSLQGHDGWVTSVCFSPDGTRLATASSDKTVKVWDAQTGQEALTLKGAGGPLCFSPDGRRLASAGDGTVRAWDTVRVWDAQTGRKILTLEGHTGWVTSVCFSPDGRRLATASSDKTVKVWDAQTGQEVLAFKGPGYPVAACFSPDGRHLASASWDETVKVWDATPLEEPPARPPNPAKL